MADVVSVQWMKRGILALLIGALALSSTIFAMDASAQRPRQQEFEDANPIELLLLGIQIDYMCTNKYTGVDRLGNSVPAMGMIMGFASNADQGLSFFDGGCRAHETTRLSLSFNPQLMMQNFAKYGSGFALGAQ